MPSIANTNRDRKVEARIDPPEPSTRKTHGPIFGSGLPYIEPELTGEWPFVTCDMILAEYEVPGYRRPGVDSAIQQNVEAA